MQPQLRNRFNPSKDEEEQESILKNESNSEGEIEGAKATSVDEGGVGKAEAKEKKEKTTSRVCASSQLSRESASFSSLSLFPTVGDDKAGCTHCASDGPYFWPKENKAVKQAILLAALLVIIEHSVREEFAYIFEPFAHCDAASEGLTLVSFCEPGWGSRSHLV